jgi:processing peptidase subunit beta
LCGFASFSHAHTTSTFFSVKFNSQEVAHIAVAYEAASWTSEYAFPLMLMQVILGEYDRTQGLGRNHASRMCEEIAENELAHSVKAFNTCYKDTGLFGVYMVCQDVKADDLMWHVMNNLVRLVHKPSEEEVERAKLHLKATMLMGLDGHSNVCEDIGRQLLTYGRRMTPAEIFQRIDAVEVNDIRATAAKFINDQDHAMAAVGGIHGTPDYNWVRRHSYWLRY